MMLARAIGTEAITSKEAKGNSRALDQYRGFALILVLCSHGLYFINHQNGVGRLGVNLFFFISGILVFRSLTSSSALKQSYLVRAVAFWKRRIVRLTPALFAYLAIMVFVVYFSRQDANVPAISPFIFFIRSLPYAVFYLIDFDAGPQPCSLGQLWSVAVEMQFYLIAPIIFWLGGRSNAQRNVVWAAFLLAFLSLGIHEAFQGSQEKYQFQGTVWPMMLGFLMEYHRKWFAGLPGWLLLSVCVAGWLLTLSSLALMMFAHQKLLGLAIGEFIIVPCFLSYVVGYALPGAFGRAFSWLGERTYSIYLWQQPLTICGLLPSVLSPFGVALSLAVGAVSYHTAERPFLSSKRRLPK